MKTFALTLGGAAVVAVLASSIAFSQPGPGSMMSPPPFPGGAFDPRWMGSGGIMGPGMMFGGGMMGNGMSRMMIVIMDSDGDGFLSLGEFQAVHARVFSAMDSNKDGKLTAKEMEEFMHDEAPSAR